MPVRIPDIPGLQASQINAAPMSANAAGAPAAALGQLAESIASVSEPFARVALQIQGVENARRESEARQRWSTGYADLTLALSKEADPAKHLERMEAFLQQSRQQWDEGDLAPVSRARLTQDFDQFATGAKISTARNAAELAMKRGRMALDQEVGGHLRLGHTEEARESLFRMAPELGMTPEEQNAYLLNIDRDGSLSAIDVEMEYDVNGVIARLENREEFLANNPALDETDRKRALGAAKSKLQELRADDNDLLETAYLSNNLRPEDIDAAVHLTEKDRLTWHNALGKADPPSNEAHTKAWALMDALRAKRTDPNVTDEDYRAAWNETRADALKLVPSKWAGDLNQELSYLSAANRSSRGAGLSGVRADASDMAAFARGIFSRGLDAGTFGRIDKDAPAAERENAYQTAHALSIMAKDYANRRPDLNLEKMKAWAKEQMDLAIDAGGVVVPSSPAVPAVPPRMDFDKEYDEFQEQSEEEFEEETPGTVLPSLKKTD
jgi:hypothetical protein